MKVVVDPKKDSSDSSSSSSSSSDDSDSKIGAKKSKTKTESKNTSLGSTSESHSNAGMAKNKAASVPTKVEDMEQCQPTKKRRTGIDDSAFIVTATEAGPSSLGRKGSNGRVPVNERFKRVDPDKVEPIADNRYVAKVR